MATIFMKQETLLTKTDSVAITTKLVVYHISGLEADTIWLPQERCVTVCYVSEY